MLRNQKSKLLFLSHRIPYPPDKGEKIRSYHFLKHLCKNYDVYLVFFVDDKEDLKHIHIFDDMAVFVYYEYFNPKIAKLKALSGIITGKALTLPYFYSPAMKNTINAIYEKNFIDVEFCYSSAMAQYLRKADITTRIVDFVDMDSDKWQQYAKAKHFPMNYIFNREANKLLEFEQNIAKQSDASLLVSSAEADLFYNTLSPQKVPIHPLENGVDTNYFTPDRNYENPYLQHNNKTILCFTGTMDYTPNIDAVVYFVKEVMPFCDKNIVFYIVGSKPSEEVQNLHNNETVIVTGRVSDVRPYIQYAHISIAPIRMARGIQNKVLEAMSMAKTVFVSSAALEGIHAIENEHLILCKNTTDWIQALKNYIQDPIKCRFIGKNARNLMLSRYSWQSKLQDLDTIIENANLYARNRFGAAHQRSRKIGDADGGG